MKSLRERGRVVNNNNGLVTNKVRFINVKTYYSIIWICLEGLIRK